MLHKDEQSRRRAFESIVQANSEQLYWHIRQMVLNHDDANDILQNTFIKAWTNIDSFQANSKISTWLYRIAINETLTFINKQRNITSIDIDDPDIGVGDRLESDPYFDGNETERQLQEAIATLPEKQRMVFNMKYFDDMFKDTKQRMRMIGAFPKEFQKGYILYKEGKLYKIVTLSKLLMKAILS